MESRKDKDQYFADICKVVSHRATCLKLHVGAVIVKDGMIVSTGYNGAPKHMDHCETCLRMERNISHGEHYEICRSVHAEQNAIIQAALHGVSIKDSMLYCTNLPCSICAKMIINAGLKKIYYRSGYADAISGDMLQEASIEIIKLAET